MKALIIYLLVFIAFLILFSLWGFYQAVRPFKITSSITPKNFGIAYENVSFTTMDNIVIRGWFIPSPHPKAKTIILLHGYPADKGNILPSRLFLYPSYNLLFFDFRYLGESGGKYSTLGKNEVLDLLAAIKYLNSRGINDHIGVWGFSLGGAVALMTAAQTNSIKALVIESAYARLDWLAEEYYRLPVLNYPLNKLTQLWAWLFLKISIKEIMPINEVRKIHAPILFIYSEKDDVISFRHAKLFQKTLEHNPNAHFIITKHTPHGGPIDNQDRIVKEFFDKYL